MMKIIAEKDARIRELEELLGNLELRRDAEPRPAAVDHQVAEAAYKEAVSTVGRGHKTYNSYCSKATLDGAMLAYAMEYAKARSAGCSLEVCPKEVSRFVDDASQNQSIVRAAMKAFPEYSFEHPLKKDEFVYAPSYGMWRAVDRMMAFEWGDAEGFTPQTKYGTKAYTKLTAK